MKTLVVYFSAEGHTARLSKEFAESAGADVYEIVPEKPYTAEDINWRNPLSRCNKEKFGKKDVPVAGGIENFGDYDTFYIGFPIWYGCAPNVVNTFCKGYDWTGKTVKIFATSGGSGIGKTQEKLQPYLKGADVKGAKLVRSAADLAAWE